MSAGFGDWVQKFLLSLFGSSTERVIDGYFPILERIRGFEADYAKKSDAELCGTTARLRARHGKGEALPALLPEAFAAVREASARVLGMRHYDVQLIGGIVLHEGKISEMVTGEGKTLVATLPAYLNAIPGRGVHVITVNDYLARRDAEWMGPIYEALGLTVGVIQNQMDNVARKVAYAADITYGTNNEFGFDYLRDNMKISRADQVQRELHYAIVDEVDSILIDEARTPLIIAGPSGEPTEKYYLADKIVRQLKAKPANLPPDAEGDWDFVVKEKEHQCLLTEQGIEKAERLLGVDSFYTPKNMDWPHHITEALRAHWIYKRDHHYVVVDDEDGPGVVIVDEFTGRMMPGRRWSDGLHQAVEAKEGLRVREENQTLATITLQNLFRLYKKLAGMTGTATTEAEEFYKIYKLEVVPIPTHRPLIRTAWPDVVYLKEPAKFDAIEEEIVRLHSAGRPLLVGTISIEKSEHLSERISRRGVPHQVLNAKQHEREAQIVSKAGLLGAVTIATNMAGRGTDIILGAFTEQQLLDHWVLNGLAPRGLRADRPRAEVEEALLRHWADHFLEPEGPVGKVEKPPAEPRDLPLDEIRSRLEKAWEGTHHPRLRLCRSVAELGGLHILGTERHEARRIDNQLRGRAGRQGDPGTSQFFLSLEDQLMRWFAGPWVQAFLRRLGMQEHDDITSPMVSRQIERAQKKVEIHNFEIRKNLLEYDEVMNEQRKLIYEMRQDVLETPDQRERVVEMLEQSVRDACATYMNPGVDASDRDAPGLWAWLRERLGIETTAEGLRKEDALELPKKLSAQARSLYEGKEGRIGEETLRRMETFVLLDTIDAKWKDHLLAMDHLRGSIGMRSYAQVDPKIEFKKDGYAMFRQMLESVRSDVAGLLFRLEPPPDVASLAPVQHFMPESESGGSEARPAAPPSEVRDARREALQRTNAPPAEQKPAASADTVGRNDPCPCGSGKKYKKCHGK